MIDFLKLYWKEIIEIILVIASVVLCVVRKRPVKVIDTLREVVTRCVPGAIAAAEKQKNLKGDGKKLFALSVVRQLIMDLGYEVTDDLMQFASEYIEAVLSTPQKKGVNYEEKN